jgi:lipoate-protein ligase A
LDPTGPHPFPPPSGGTYLNVSYPDIAANLALDEALLIAAEDHGFGPSVRVWESAGLAVVLGASCRLDDDVNRAACLADGVPVARRSSGGGTVVVGPGAVNVGVVLASDSGPGLDAVDTAQAFVLGRFADALRRLGLPAEVQGHGDLTFGDRKFAGSAQRRLRHHFLVHVSVLRAFPIEPVLRYTRPPRRQPAYRAGRGHADFLTDLQVPRDALLSALTAPWTAMAPTDRTSPLLDGLVRDLIRDKFGDPTWVERF